MRADRSLQARVAPLIAALAIAGALGGCGGSGGSQSGGDPSGPLQPTPYRVLAAGKPIGPPPHREDIDDAQRRIAAAGASGDCERIADVFVTGSPAGKTTSSCELISSIGASKPTGLAAYGNEAGVIDYATSSRGATLVMIRQADGLFHIVFTIAHSKAASAGTPLGKGADAVATSAVEAIHHQNCDAVLSLAFPGSAVSALGKPKACFLLANDPIQGALFNDPKARPAPLGGNALFAFYGLDTPRSYVVAVLARAGLTGGPNANPARGPYRYLGSFASDRPSGLE